MKLDFNLTPEQLKYKEGVEWLLSAPRACGKTTLLACCIIEHAFNNPGVKSYFQEPLAMHWDTKYYLGKRIREILATLKEVNQDMRISIGQGWVQYR